MIETESKMPSSIRRNKSMTRLFERVQAMEVFQKNKQRIRRLRQRNRGRGFKVDLPPKFLMYTIFIFIILPLLLGSFFLARTVLFGSLKEDESHPLHKKQPHLRKPNNITDSTRTIDDTFPGGGNIFNVTETETKQDPLGNNILDADETQVGISDTDGKIIEQEVTSEWPDSMAEQLKDSEGAETGTSHEAAKGSGDEVDVNQDGHPVSTSLRKEKDGHRMCFCQAGPRPH